MGILLLTLFGSSEMCDQFEKSVRCKLEYPYIILDISAGEEGMTNEVDCQNYCVSWNQGEHQEKCSHFTWLEKMENNYHCVLLSQCEGANITCPSAHCVSGRGVQNANSGGRGFFGTILAPFCLNVMLFGGK